MRFYLTIALVVLLMSGCTKIASTSWKNMNDAPIRITEDDLTASQVGEVIESDVIYY
jgi:hypothetical protein